MPSLRASALKRVRADDGEYEFDVFATFTALGGAEFKVVVECKAHKKPIGRRFVQELEQKRASTRTNKAMLFSTSRFTADALKFAEAHNIALIEVTDESIAYQTRAHDLSTQPPVDHQRLLGWAISVKQGRITMSSIQGSDDIAPFWRHQD